MLIYLKFHNEVCACIWNKCKEAYGNHFLSLLIKTYSMNVGVEIKMGPKSCPDSHLLILLGASQRPMPDSKNPGPTREDPGIVLRANRWLECSVGKLTAPWILWVCFWQRQPFEGEALAFIWQPRLHFFSFSENYNASKDLKKLIKRIGGNTDFAGIMKCPCLLTSCPALF